MDLENWGAILNLEGARRKGPDCKIEILGLQQLGNWREEKEKKFEENGSISVATTEQGDAVSSSLKENDWARDKEHAEKLLLTEIFCS